MPYKDPKDRAKYKKAYRARKTAKKKANAFQVPVDGIPPPPGGIPGDLPPRVPNQSPSPCPADAPLRTAADALAVLREQMNEVRADRATGVQVRSRTITYILSIGLKAIELADLSERIAALEARIGK